jgi:hypothetical protein
VAQCEEREFYFDPKPTLISESPELFARGLGWAFGSLYDRI